MKISFVLPLFLGKAVHSSIVMAQSPGTFTAKWEHSDATLLLRKSLLLAV
jgi:hypothetical protein